MKFKNKRKNMSDSSSEEDEEEDLSFNLQNSQNNEGPQDEWFDANFDFCDPTETDFHSIKLLIQNGGLFTNHMTNTSHMADLISNQGNVGITVKTDSDDADSIIAILSILNLKQYEQLSSLSIHLLEMSKKHGDETTYKTFESILKNSENHVGYIINERFVNLPPSLLPKMYESIQEDVRWSQTTTEMLEDERPFYFFTHLLLFTKLYGEDTKTQSEKKRKQKGRTPNTLFLKPEEASFRHFEEKELYKHSTAQVIWLSNKTMRFTNVMEENEQNGGTEILTEYYGLFLIPYEKLKIFIEELKLMVPDSVPRGSVVDSKSAASSS